MKKILRPRSFGMIVLALILAASVYGFANSNTVPGTYAGDGNNTISGYTITNVSYSIYGDNDPTDIEGISFDLDANAGAVYVSFDNGTTWNDCSPGSPSSSISCTGLSESVLGATQLRIIATN
ncbi:MAG: hypothetical protein PVF85_09755 [Anaerolineales bacterium]|jgi:hypothetical protein